MRPKCSIEIDGTRTDILMLEVLLDIREILDSRIPKAKKKIKRKKNKKGGV